MPAGSEAHFGTRKSNVSVLEREKRFQNHDQGEAMDEGCAAELSGKRSGLGELLVRLSKLAGQRGRQNNTHGKSAGAGMPPPRLIMPWMPK